MKLNKWICAVTLALVLCMLGSVAMAAANVSSYDQLRDAILANEMEINITDDFSVTMYTSPWVWLKLPEGCHINGNGHTIKLLYLYNGSNGDFLFSSKGKALIENITFDASEMTRGSRVASLTDGDVMRNVTIIGGGQEDTTPTYGVSVTYVGDHVGTATFTNCTFKDLGHAIYNTEHSDVAPSDPVTLKITNSEFDDCEYATNLREDNSIFSGNAVDGGKLNALGASTITANTFDGESRIKFYYEDSAKDFSGNQINDDSYIENQPAAKDTDLSKNQYENITKALASDTISDTARNNAIIAAAAANTPAYSAPKTGDNSQLALWMCMLVLAGAGMILMGKKRADAQR